MTNATFHFTGIRKELYDRRRRVNRALGFLFGASLIPTVFFHSKVEFSQAGDIIGFIVIACFIIYVIYGLIKHETVLQLLTAEQKASERAKDENLQSLHSYANKIVKKGKGADAEAS